MPRARSDMRRIREVLRLRDEFGASQRQIADACRLPRSTVRDYLERLRAAGLRYADVLGWTDIELEARLFPPPAATVRPVPDWRHISHELGRRGVTLRLLWQEYLEVHSGGYRYTQFVQHFRAWQAAQAEPRLRREHRPGAAIEVDYAGMTLTVGVGADARPAQVFVACLPYSGYVYAEATWTQQLDQWLASHLRLFEHLGGVPAKLVPGASANAEGGTTLRSASATPPSTIRPSTRLTRTSPATTEPPSCRPGCAGHAISPAPRTACSRSSGACWPPCAMRPWPRWTPPTRLCATRWPNSTPGP